MSEKPVVLVVDDKPNMLRLVKKVLAPTSKVLVAQRGQEAITLLEERRVDIVISDLRMPDVDGLAVLAATRRLRPEAEFILMTAFATIDTAVAAMKDGAYDYLTKPIDPDDIRLVVQRVLNHRAHTADSRGDQVLPGVLAVSPAMLEMAAIVRRVAASDLTVLILGETGTGKERIARAVHDLSPRHRQRFVAVNCAAIPKNLLESELFGHARGSFTGASHARPGLFEDAHRGTLFLDEVGEMSLDVQSKLTRVLEQRAVRRVGESHERSVDVRVVAATHRDLPSMIAAGSFREDLWYRLDVARIVVPPLRDREGDVEMLAKHFLAEAASMSPTHELRGFTETALDALRGYAWPGNVRQLKACIERTAVMTRNARINRTDLPTEVAEVDFASRSDLSSMPWAAAIKKGQRVVARQYLEAVLDEYEGNVAAAAEHAQVERESFYRLLRKHGLDPANFRKP